MESNPAKEKGNGHNGYADWAEDCPLAIAEFAATLLLIRKSLSGPQIVDAARALPSQCTPFQFSVPSSPA
jgi:hypothetical protein